MVALALAFMNKNQAKGAAKTAAGTIQRGAGELVGSEKQQAKGVVKQIKGKAQRRIGDAQAALKDSRKRKSK